MGSEVFDDLNVLSGRSWWTNPEGLALRGEWW